MSDTQEPDTTVEHVHMHTHHADTHAGDDGSEDHHRSEAPGAIEIEHLHYVYPDGTEALRGIDVRVTPGERVALVGPNGAGKSTLILHLNGILEPTHGLVRIGGTVVDRASASRIRAAVGMVFQDPDDQLFSPTVYEDVAFGPLHMGMTPELIHERVEAALAAVGMTGSERRMPTRLSLGQRKRVAMATVLSMDPSILVFDEPTAGLDPRGRREFIRLMTNMSHTLIVSTHDMALVAESFPRTIILDDGRVSADGATDQLLADTRLLEAHGLEAP
jgi:cobalt/nickel transport system ATP-binding protein